MAVEVRLLQREVGVIVNPDGYIVTNNHVIQGAEQITVVLNKDKKEYKAEIIGTDPSSDLALIKIDKKDLPSIVFGKLRPIKRRRVGISSGQSI